MTTSTTTVKSRGFTRESTPIPGLYVITPTLFGDDRGFFMETYNADDFRALGIDCQFIQDNHSRSKQGVLRGLHFQTEHPQAKLVRVLSGEVFDVAVDLRPGSATFGQWHGVLLSAENQKQFFIPRGFAHGFLVLSDSADFTYKVDNLYDPAHEAGLPFDDPDLAIDWPALPAGVDYLLSDKDRHHPSFKTYQETNQ